MVFPHHGSIKNVLSDTISRFVILHECNFLFTINISIIKVLYICDTMPLKPSRKEGNVLFNDALKTFYLLLYGVRNMVKGPFR